MPDILRAHDFKRVKREYSPKGRMVRAALDFATKSPYFHGFRNGSAITVDEMRKDAIQRFENREVESAIFSWLVPLETEGRNVFTIVFKKWKQNTRTF